MATNEEILGLRAFMRWRFRTPMGERSAVRAVDTSTHPNYRRLGVFSRLTRVSVDRARESGVHLIFNTPNPQSMAGYLKLGWQRVGRPRLLVKVLRPWRVVPALIQRRSAKLTPEDVPGFFSGSGPETVEESLANGDRMERLLARDDALRADGIRTERSVAFLRWRYGTVPSPSYFALWGGTAPDDGCVIFRPNIRRGLREIMISEWLTAGEGEPETRRLVARLAQNVRADYLVASATPGTPHWRVLRGAGFIPMPERFGPNFTVFPLTWSLNTLNPARLENWRLSLGDLELF
jgi:hypothetical protein